MTMKAAFRRLVNVKEADSEASEGLTAEGHGWGD